MLKNLTLLCILVAVVFLFACHDASNSTVVDTPNTDTTDEVVGDYLGKFKWTHYYIVYESDYPGAKDTKIMYWKDCSTIVNVSKGFYDAVKIEGTGYVSDGRLINLYGTCPCSVNYKCFYLLDQKEFPYGEGRYDRALVPYRSVAADFSVVPFGTRLYIPELVGVVMPDEKGVLDNAPFTHDGCVTVEDEGSSVKGKHLDFFSHTYVDYKKMDADMNDIGEVDVYMNSAKCQ